MKLQAQAITTETVELHWRGAALGSVRDGRFCAERFSLPELQELVALVNDQLTPRRREIIQIIELVGAECDVALTDLLSRSKRSAVSEARMIAISLVGDFFGHMGDDKIAIVFQRERSAVTWSRSQVKNRMETEPKFKELISRLRREVQEKLFPKSKAA